jgi:nicotinate-nucleotide--dimethylbenzimidazole phosphoribosyltransferase
MEIDSQNGADPKNETACWCMELPTLDASQIESNKPCLCRACLLSKAIKAPSPEPEFLTELDTKILNKTMPAGALGRVIEIARLIACVQETLTIRTDPIEFWIFAADHGLAKEPISAYPQDVTWQMVLNFLNEGAAINCFARAHQIQLNIVNAGVAHEFTNQPALIHLSIAQGTDSTLTGPAMTLAQAQLAITRGYDLVAASQAPIVGFGEMGIGNSSAAALLTAALTGANLDQCIGLGTGVSSSGLEKKREILNQVFTRYKGQTPSNGIPIALHSLTQLGGFEIAMMTGALLGAAAQKKVALVDGFIATSAALVACSLNPNVRHYLLFSHCSAEQGHRLALEHLKAKPFLDLGLRLGEGTGAALAVPLVRSAAAFFNEMASFESAGVQQSDV